MHFSLRFPVGEAEARGSFMIAGSSGQIATKSARDHGMGRRRVGVVGGFCQTEMWAVLSLVNGARCQSA